MLIAISVVFMYMCVNCVYGYVMFCLHSFTISKIHTKNPEINSGFLGLHFMDLLLAIC